MLYRFNLVCPTCRTECQTVKEWRGNPRLNCGNCLVERADMVELKVVKVGPEPTKQDAVRLTRFPELGYARHAANLWRIIATDTGSAVGPHYASKAELLADLSRYATDYGCNEGGL